MTLQEVHGVPPTPVAAECKIGTYLRTLDPEDADDLRAALWSKLSAARLAKVLRTLRIDVGATTIKMHRSKTCACYQGVTAHG